MEISHLRKCNFTDFYMLLLSKIFSKFIIFLSEYRIDCLYFSCYANFNRFNFQAFSYRKRRDIQIPGIINFHERMIE